jgi:hypothetical protein
MHGLNFRSIYRYAKSLIFVTVLLSCHAVQAQALVGASLGPTLNKNLAG